MHLPITIGRDSSGTDYTIDLCSLPNLVISYNEEDQLAETFDRLIKGIAANPSVQFALTSENKLAERSIHQFVDELVTEFKRRKPKQRLSPILFYPMVVLIDNIFEVIVSTRKKTGLQFIELLVSGPQRSIYFIAGSTGIYKNLLDQIIHLNPVLKRKLIKSNPAIKINDPLAAEMIINPDGLIFFRQRGERVYLRLYPV